MNLRVVRLLWPVALVACGRLNFKELADGSNDLTDGSNDLADASAPCPGFAAFCDDFETGDLSKWTAVKLSIGGTAIVDSVDVHAGLFSLNATMPGLGNGAIAAACLDSPRSPPVSWRCANGSRHLSHSSTSMP